MCYVREHMKLQRGAGVRCVTGQSIRRAARSWCVLYEAAAESWYVRAHTVCREKLACARYTKPQRKAGVCESIRRAVRSRRVLGIRSRNGKRVCACALCEVGARARWTQRLRRHKILAVSRRVTPTNGLVLPAHR